MRALETSRRTHARLRVLYVTRMGTMSQALQCDYCGKFVTASKDRTKRWFTMQLAPSVQDEGDEPQQQDFCSREHAALSLLSKATLESGDMRRLLENVRLPEHTASFRASERRGDAAAYATAIQEELGRLERELQALVEAQA